VKQNPHGLLCNGEVNNGPKKGDSGKFRQVVVAVQLR